MAQDLAAHATWGVTPGVYESASSSPAWTLLMAALFKTVSWRPVMLPLAVNIAAAVALLLAFARLQPLLQLRGGRGLALAALLPAALALPVLTMVGMEPILLSLAALVVLVLLQRIVERCASPLEWAGYLGLLTLLPLLRFEGLFLAAGCAAGLALDAWSPAREAYTSAADRARRLLEAGLSVALPAATAGVTALVNLAHGQYALPNPVVAKSALGGGGVASLLPSFEGLSERLAADTLLAALLAGLAAYLVISVLGGPRRHRSLCLAWVIAAVAHCSFSLVGSFDRYQEYLVVGGVFIALLVVADVASARWRPVAAALLVPALVVLPMHKYLLHQEIAVGANNVYEQQLQMATFLEGWYDGEAVAVNDLGLVAYRHRGPVVDLLGLGSIDVLRERKADAFDSAAMARVVSRNDVHVVVVYDTFFPGMIPPGWTRVAQWRLSRRDISSGSPEVSWYAPTAADVPTLSARLHRFAPRMPAEVLVHFAV
jgi:hypothetical protein